MTENLPATTEPTEDDKIVDRAVSLFVQDPESENKCIADIIDKRLAESFKEMEADPRYKEYFAMDEHRLKKRLKKEQASPSATDNTLRLAFWREYDRCMARGYGKMMMTHVYAGATTHEYFYYKYIKNPFLVAWMLCPPASYEKALDETLNFSIIQMRKILEYDDKNSKGVLNMKLLELKLKIFNLVDQRKKGGILQRSENKTLNLNLSNKSALDQITNHSLAEIEEKIKRLEAKEVKEVKKVIEVESEPVEDLDGSETSTPTESGEAKTS